MRAAPTQSYSRNVVCVNTEQHRLLLDPLLERVVVQVEQTAGEWQQAQQAQATQWQSATQRRPILPHRARSALSWRVFVLNLIADKKSWNSRSVHVGWGTLALAYSF